jgi:anti-sigma factor RsiW
MVYPADSAGPDEDGHPQLSLGAYVLGKLPRPEVAAVEAHMAGCARCSLECAELSEARAALAMLADEPALPVRRYGTPYRIAVLDPPPRRAAPAVPRVTLLAQPRQRSKVLWYARVTAVVLVICAGLVAAAQSITAVQRGAARTITVTATDRQTGANLVLRVLAGGDRTRVIAWISAPAARADYQLFAVTRTGDAYVITRWVADGRTMTLSGELAIPPNALVFFGVVRQDGVIIVSVPYRTGTTPR